MRLKKLTLNNFGIYYGENQIDFNTSEKNNVILVHGENGSGKTTMLNAIKVAIYGPGFMGYKRTNKKYLEFIKNKINSDALSNKSIKNYHINLEIEILEDGEYIDYNFIRKWYKTSYGNLKEEFLVYRENEKLSELKKEQFHNSLLSSIPYILFNLYFFDGEKIKDLFISDNNDYNIKKMFDIIFNLELFNILDVDLKNYILQRNVYDKLEKHQKELIDLKKDMAEKKELINKIEVKIDIKKEKLITKSDKLKDLEKKYKVNQGLLVNQKDKVYKEISKLMKRKNKLKSNIDQVVIEFLPFILIKNSVNNLVDNIKRDKEISHKKYLLESIEDEKFNDFLDSNSINKDKKVVDVLKDYFSINKTDQKYSFNMEEEHIIHLVNNNINKIDTDKLVNNINEIEKINKKLLEKRKIYKKNQSDEFIDKLEKINELKESIDKLNIEKEELEVKLENLKEELNVLKDEKKDKKKDIRDSKKDKSVFGLTEKIQKVIDLYTKRIAIKKVKELSKYTTNIFKKLIRKDDFIKKIEIDSELNIKIYNKKNNIVPKENLSSGETQIYVLSLLWGMIKVSDRKIPLVFDTLLGRLDKSHKANIINEFMGDISDQIIILATDSEVDDEYHDLLEDKISKEYTLNYNDLRTKIKSAS